MSHLQPLCNRKSEENLYSERWKIGTPIIVTHFGRSNTSWNPEYSVEALREVHSFKHKVTEK